MVRQTLPRRAGQTRPAQPRIEQSSPQGDQSRTGWSALAILGRSSQATSALTSLAQPRAATHQEYKIAVGTRVQVFQRRNPSVAENAPLFSTRLCRLS